MGGRDDVVFNVIYDVGCSNTFSPSSSSLCVMAGRSVSSPLVTRPVRVILSRTYIAFLNETSCNDECLYLKSRSWARLERK
jgi:hypothetical protein